MQCTTLAAKGAAIPTIVPATVAAGTAPTENISAATTGRMPTLHRSTLFILMALSGTAWGQQTSYDLGEMVVNAARYEPAPVGATSVSASTLDALQPATSDSATLLRDVPGVSLYSAGGVSSLPAIHGLADDRVRTQVDGMDLLPACPNHMNPALSYIDPTSVGKIDVYAGITPVSVGGDSLGGTIQVESAPPEFAAAGAGLLTKGEIGAFYRSNGSAHGSHLKATVADENLSATYSGSAAQSNNYTAAGDFKPAGPAATDRGWLDGDEVGSSAYKTLNQALDIALRSGEHLFDLKLARQHIPYEGFPNQRMDMTRNDSDRINLGYTGHYGWGVLKARVYNQSTDHEMQFGDDKQYIYGTAPGMPMNTSAYDTGARIKADIPLANDDVLRVGGEFQHYTLNDWWPPSGTGGMSPNTFLNINDGKRDRYALYGEWEKHYNKHWMSQLGVRHETVVMDTGDVHGYCISGMCMGSQIADSAAFNAADRGKTDQNWDLTAVARYIPDATQRYEFGIAQKTRSPNLYERYTWSTWPMAAVMNNFAGDGNGYVGNLELKPEIAYTVSLSADWHDADDTQWGLKVTPYYTYVRDYIDARCLPGATCNADQFNVLQYVNEEAALYGVDMSGHFPLAHSRNSGDFSLTSELSYVRGKNRSSGDNLYNIMPLNAKVTVEQRLGHWTNSLEAQFVESKQYVSSVRNEIATAGYSLFNLRTRYQWQQVRLDIGIENLFNRFYNLPLGGAYAGQGKTMSINGIPWGTAVPGMGRSVYTSLSYRF